MFLYTRAPFHGQLLHAREGRLRETNLAEIPQNVFDNAAPHAG
mgnify:CR=1 FL=1